MSVLRFLGLFGFLISVCLAGCVSEKPDVIKKTDRTKREKPDLDETENTQEMKINLDTIDP